MRRGLPAVLLLALGAGCLAQESPDDAFSRRCTGIACEPAPPPLTLTVVAPTGRTLGQVQVTGARAYCGAVSAGEAQCHVEGGAGTYALDVTAPGYRAARVEVEVPASTPVPGQCCTIPYVEQTAWVELVPEA